MRYKIVLIKTKEGYSVSCPALRGCHSQGKTKRQALQNIKSAIREWLDAESKENEIFSVIEEEVTVDA